MCNGAVLICGLGIAGATLAYWLSEHGFEPTLIERASDLREGGSVMDLSGVGYEVAERMGLKPDLKAQGYNVQEVRFVDRRGHRIGGFDAHVFRSQTRGRYVSLTRG